MTCSGPDRLTDRKAAYMSYKIVLASASPRRRELLKEMGLEYTVVPVDVNEYIEPDTPPHLACMNNALKKAQAAAASGGEDTISIGADTIVYCESILGKPEDEADAFRTLQMLRNRAHQVYTGVGIVSGDGRIKKVFYDCTDVVFDDYPDADIEEYIRSGEPMDKAGSYAIQGGWYSKVCSVNGSISNVIGLPTEKLERELSGIGILL